MKIAFFSSDPGNHHFIQPIIDRLALSGHECQLYNNWTIVEDADVYWFDFTDNNLIAASRDDKEELKKKKVIARLHCIEAYLGFHKQIDWTCVDHLIFVAEHFKRKCSDIEYPENLKIHVIENGIDLKRFTYRQRGRDSAKLLEPWNFAYVGNIVPYKGILSFLHYFATIKAEQPDAKWYLAGLRRMPPREEEYWEHAKKAIGGIYEEEFTGDVNQWLDDRQIHMVVQPSCAESFSFILGEALAKGIKVATNNWVGAEEMWPKDMVYSNYKEFCEILEAPYESARYRKLVEERYDIDQKVKQVEELLQ